MTTHALTACTAIWQAFLAASCSENSAPPAEKPAASQAGSDPAEASTTASAAQASSLPDPCRLVTDNEINEVLRPNNNGYKVSGRTFVPYPDIGGGKCEIE